MVLTQHDRSEHQHAPHRSEAVNWNSHSHKSTEMETSVGHLMVCSNHPTIFLLPRIIASQRRQRK